MSQKLFAELGLSPEILKAVEKMGFETASPIQAEAIPHLLEGKDMIGQSATGSGKTAAFAIPAIERVDASAARPQVLILCPTRELASQVAEEVAKLAAFKKGVRELPIYGGASYDRQFRGLRAGPQIIIGTPGRVVDHIGNGALQMDSIKTIILDEADRMLDMGFREELDQVLQAVPEEGRQTVLFSATMPEGIRNIIARFTKDPVRVKIENTAATIPAIEQGYVDVDWRSKTEALCRMLDVNDVKYGIIFCFTKLQTDEVCEALNARGYSADKLHGDMTQAMRERVMKRFRERKIELLVATDVAARGLDVDDLEIVFNYELPHDPEDYVHRIGRTGRAGKSGKAISLISGREYGRLQQVMRFTKTQIPRLPVPKIDEVSQKQTDRLTESLKECLDAGEYPVQDELVEKLLTDHTPNQIISALMYLLNDELARPVERIREDDQRAPAQRRPAPTREPRAPHTGEVTGVTDQNSAWLKLSVGRNAGLMPGDVVGCIAGESGLPREVIGAIRILPTLTLVQVAREHAEQILQAINGVRLRNMRLSAAEGSPPAPMGEGRPSGPRRPNREREDFDGGGERGWEDAHRPSRGYGEGGSGGPGFGRSGFGAGGHGPARRPYGGAGRGFGPPRRSFGGEGESAPPPRRNFGGEGSGGGEGGGYDRPPPRRRFD